MSHNTRLLHAFLREHSIRQREVAVLLGVSTANVNRILRGRQRPTLDQAFALDEFTGGVVPAAGWTSNPPIDRTSSGKPDDPETVDPPTRVKLPSGFPA